MKTLGHLLQKTGGDLSVGRVFREIDWDENLLRLGVDIPNINTTLVGKENPIALFAINVSLCFNVNVCTCESDQPIWVRLRSAGMEEPPFVRRLGKVTVAIISCKAPAPAPISTATCSRRL